MGKVLEDFEDGENVHIDKGVHDGRRAEEVPPLHIPLPLLLFLDNNIRT